MSKVSICDLCNKKILAHYKDVAYKFIVKKRWWSYDGYEPHRKTNKLDICDTCMIRIINAQFDHEGKV